MCLPSQIKAGNGPRIGGALGERSFTVTFTNRRTAACVLDGYPHVRLLTSAGTVLNLPQVARSFGYVTDATPRLVLLGPGATGYVLVAKYRQHDGPH